MAAKDIQLRPIPSSLANETIKRLHYSGKVVNNSQIHIGVYYQGKLEGAMQFGPSLDKRKMIGLVEGTLWNEFIELNRMAFSEKLPRNSESRAIAVAMRILKKHAPQLKWVVSFADGCQCGDGTIYRASGFVLTAIKENNQIWVAPDGAETLSRGTATKGKNICHSLAERRGYAEHGGLNLGKTIHTASARPGIGAISTAARQGGGSSMKAYAEAGYKPLPGFQLRYLYFLDPTCQKKLTCPILPFSEIEKRGAAMYKGKPRAGSIDNDVSAVHAEESGANPTSALQFKK